MRAAGGTRTLDDEAAKLGRLQRDGAAVLTEDPACELRRRRVLRHEDIAFDAVALAAAVRSLDPPRRVRRHFDACLAEDVAELPLGTAAILLDVELGRQAKITFAARCEADVGADARDPECPDVVTVEVMADHIPGAILRQQGVGVQRPLDLLVPVDRPVAELDGALFRDRALELAEPALKLGRVVGIPHLDAERRSCRTRGKVAC